MISSLILLTAGLFATPVYISDVKAAREAGHLRVEVRADGGIDPEAARTVIDDGRLVIYLGGARVRADNRSWELQDGAGEIRAHRHKTETELVVPLTGNGCAGPVELTGSSSGITALVGCEGSVAAAAAKPPRNKVEKVSEKAVPSIKTLKALVELPPERATAPVVAPALAPTPAAAPGAAVADEERSKAVQAAPVATPPAVRAATIVALPEHAVLASPGSAPAPGVRRASEAKAAAPIPTPPAAPREQPRLAAAGDSGAIPPSPSPSAGGGSGFRSVALPGLLLAALAAAAYVLARRRRTTVQRHIEILETTSLGPKRSLVFARIGGETMLLGSSEAGITLLKGAGPLTAVQAARVAEVTAPEDADWQTTPPVVLANATDQSAKVGLPAPAGRFGPVRVIPEGSTPELEQPLVEALADIPEPDHGQGSSGRASFRAIEGGLASLFSRRAGGSGAVPRDEAPPAFDDLLEDSIEDQELRRKLAAGLSARVR